MATLYDMSVATINEHIKIVFADIELEETATIRKFRIVQSEGSRQVCREVAHYNLQMITAVGLHYLERIVFTYLDLAQGRAERHIPMTMEIIIELRNEKIKLSPA